MFASSRRPPRARPIGCAAAPGRGLTAIAVLLATAVAGCSSHPVPPTPGGGAVAGAQVTGRPCDLYFPPDEVEGETIECGYVKVPWDRSNPAGATADLAFVKLRAKGSDVRPDPVVHVSGGPGIGATLRQSVVELSKRYAALREDHDVILYDQRGMGRSEPYFDCPTATAAQTRAQTPALREKLGRVPTEAESATAFCERRTAAEGHPAALISTATSAADLTDLMTALGYPKYNLYGISYGTRLLMELMHTAPDSPLVRSVVLDSPYPLPEDGVNDLAASDELQYPALLIGFFDACENDSRCSRAYPDLRTEHAALVEQLNNKPLRLPDGTRYTGRDFEHDTFPQTGAIGFVAYLPRLVAELRRGSTDTLMALRSGAIPESHHVQAVTESSGSARLVDAFLECSTAADDQKEDSAYARDLMHLWDAPPVDVAQFLEGTCRKGSGRAAAALVRQLPIGSFNSVIERMQPDTAQGLNPAVNIKLLCTEEYPFAPMPAEVGTSLRDAGLPADFSAATVKRINEQRDGCAGWSQPLRRPAETTYGDFPVLVLVGGFDNVTPPDYGARTAQQLPQAWLVPVPNATHSILGNYGDCVERITDDFISSPTESPDSACAQSLGIPWVMPDDPLPSAEG